LSSLFGNAADNGNSIEVARRRRWHCLRLIISNFKQEKNRTMNCE
jgi:hypothetical protein